MQIHKLTFLFAALLVAASCQSQPHQLDDFLSPSDQLQQEVDDVYSSLSEEERVAQMIISSLGKLGKPYAAVEPLIKTRQIGGIIFLSGDPQQFKSDIEGINQLSEGWPLLMSMDAEPSLFNRRMPGTPPMGPTNQLTNVEMMNDAVSTINATLMDIGFQQNYAPVVDVSPNNEAIGNRTMGSSEEAIVPLATAFIKRTQRDQIVATAKHFPGHGRVSGDTHKKLVYIDGELTEVSIYKPMIEAGVASIMVGHIAVENNEKYNTNGMPSTCSKTIVTDLLRKEMKFDGIIITDAMNMGAVAAIPESTLLAAKAGCDLILMPPDEVGTIESIMNEMKSDPTFAQQVEESVKRIIRLKLCLGMHFNRP